MINFNKLLLILATTFTFSGCSFHNYNNNIDFNTISDDLTSNISSYIPSTLYSKSNMYITDFVNISSLDNSSQLGFILSNQVKVSILEQSSSNATIKELIIGKNIKIGKHGVKLLSRDLSHIKSKRILPNSKIIVGTYAITSKQLIVYLKLIDLDSGDLLFSKSTSTPITDEILQLEGIETQTTIYTPMTI